MKLVHLGDIPSGHTRLSSEVLVCSFWVLSVAVACFVASDHMSLRLSVRWSIIEAKGKAKLTNRITPEGRENKETEKTRNNETTKRVGLRVFRIRRDDKGKFCCELFTPCPCGCEGFLPRTCSFAWCFFHSAQEGKRTKILTLSFWYVYVSAVDCGVDQKCIEQNLVPLSTSFIICSYYHSFDPPSTRTRFQ